MEDMKKKQEKNRKCAVYARLACVNPGSEGKALNEQIEMVKGYCISNGLTVQNIYRDEGYSGSNLNRPGFQLMITDIDQGKIHIVMVDDVSRLSRSCTDLSNILEVFKEKSVELICTSGEV